MRKKHPTLGQAKVRLSRGIYITAKGFAELKDHRTRKELQADLEWDHQHLASLGTPGLYSYFISAYLCSGILVLQGDDEQGAREENPPNSRRKAGKSRKARRGMIQNISLNKAQCLRGHSDRLQLCDPALW